MSGTVRLLRHTARLLLVLTPLTLLTGFLAAKWFVAEGWVSAAAVRAWHLRWLPLAFVPVVLVHSLCGVLLLLRRSPRFDRPALRGGLVAVWTAAFGLFVWLYLAEPPASHAPTALEAEPQPADGGEATAPDDGLRPPEEPPGDADSAPDATPEVPRREAADGPAAEALPASDDVPAGTPTGADSAPDTTPTSADVPRAAEDARAARDAAADEARRAEALLQQRCTACHGLDKVRGARHDAAGWGASIDRMIGYGAAVSARERARLVRYLAGR
ncbi:MAG: hypothetical protein JXB32_04270 [Deltaproteobacteria bacterium]|nr:hypothetical protein [Deltaproteobacteria bacterium]